jgi:hypothetical protein
MDWKDSPLGSALNAEITTETSSGAEAIETTYSPSGLAASQGLPSVRKASKTLIGENGWLERTNKRPDPNTSPSRKGGFLANLVKKAKGMVSPHTTFRLYRLPLIPPFSSGRSQQHLPASQIP